MKIYVLGAGTPTPTPARFGSSYVIDVDGELIMFDCGPAATHKLVKAGLWPTAVTHLFFTHHHFDHDVDLPCFLLCRWDQSIGQEAVLRVFGPPPTKTLTEGIIGVDGLFAHDWKARIGLAGSQQVFVNRGGSLPRPAPVVDAMDVSPGFCYSSPHGWRVTAALAEHAQPYLDSLAWRLDTVDHSVVITGDTQPCATVEELARDADVMLCMCWDREERMRKRGEAVGQCGTIGAGKLAERAGVRQLVLVHAGAGLEEAGEAGAAIEDVATVFSGQSMLASELEIIELG